MVLGMVTGSVPMLFSLLLMQGITLTMWRSFLDKAIPRYNGDKFRQNIEQVVASAANLPLPTPNQVPASAPPDPGSAASIPMSNSMPSSTSMEQQSPSGLPTNSIAHSLQILSKLDPNVIQLLNTLSGKVSEPSKVSANTAPAMQQPKQPLLNSPMDELTHSGLSMSEPSGLYSGEDQSTSVPQFMQYGPNGEPLQYMQADQANQPDYAQLMQQYQYAQQYPDNAQMEQEGIDQNNYQYQTQQVPIDPNVQYQYAAEGEQPDAGTTAAYEEGDNTEMLENHQAEQAQEADGPDEAATAEEEPDKEMAEDRPHMPPVIIGPPIGGGEATHGSRGRRKKKMKKKLVASEWPRKLPKRKRKSKGMFGKPRVLRKRMLNFEPISKKFQQTKQRISRRFFTSSLRPVRTTTYRPELNGPYRFATPRYPIPLLDSPPRKDDLNRASIERPLRMESRSSVDTKMGHISVVMTNKTKKMVKLKSNKIRLFELDDVKSNCSERSSKGKFAVIWSQKSGWPKNNLTGCNPTAKPTAPNTVRVSLLPGLQKESQNTIGSEVIAEPTTSTTTIETLVSTDQPTTTIQSLLTTSATTSPPTKISKPVTTEPTVRASSVASTTQSAAENNLAQASATIPSSFLINFNQFLASLTTMAPSIPITTTTTTETPTTSTEVNISPNLVPGGADELPKEFLYHILMAINASKIDDFQVHNNRESNSIENDLGNTVPTVSTPPSRSNEADLETEEEDEDEEEENQVDWRNVADEDTRVDGKNPAGHRFKRVCYYLLDGGKDGQLDVSQLELHICSHLIVGYARISTNGLIVAERPLEDSEKYRRLTLMKLQYPKLKVLLSVGDLGGNSFSIVASSNRTRQRFAESVLDFCDEFNFDGVDIDWEFPSFRTGYKEDKTNFILLLNGLRARSNQIWRRNPNTRNANAIKSNYLISVAVGAPLIIASTSYIIPAIAKVADFVNLQSYDFHAYRPDRPYTGHHAPLYPRSTDQAYYSTLNVAWAATYWANNGMPLRKIIVGVPTYARTYNLVVPVGQNVINAPANGPGLGRGKINYTAVCQFLKLPGAMKQFDIYSQVPYAYRNYDWIAYENEMSVAIKAQWVIKTGMGGIVTFALNFDDSKGTCRDDGKKFPLQKTISNLLELASIKSYKQSSYVMKIRY